MKTTTHNDTRPDAGLLAGTTSETWHSSGTSGGQSLIISDRDGRNVAVAYHAPDGPLLAAAPALHDALAGVCDRLQDSQRILRNSRDRFIDEKNIDQAEAVQRHLELNQAQIRIARAALEASQ